MVVRATALLVAALVVPGLASAQTVQAFERLPDQLNAGDRVRVVDRDGVRHDGTVRTLPPDALVIVGSGGPQGFTEETTVSVARRGAQPGSHCARPWRRSD